LTDCSACSFFEATGTCAKCRRELCQDCVGTHICRRGFINYLTMGIREISR